jgi:hypothetical protein
MAAVYIRVNSTEQSVEAAPTLNPVEQSVEAASTLNPVEQKWY